MQGIKRPPRFLKQAERAIIDSLAIDGIRAEVDAQRIPFTKCYRLAVLSAQFKAMRFMERQDLLWRIVQKAISREEQMRISTIWAVTPDELEGKRH